MVCLSFFALSLSLVGTFAAPPHAVDHRRQAVQATSTTEQSGLAQLFARWNLANLIHADAAATPNPKPPKGPGSPHPPKPQPSATVKRTWALGKLNVTPGIIAQLDNGYYVAFQGDANLVVYGPNNAVEWASNTSTGTGTCSDCSLTFQSDGNLVIYNGGAAIWSTGTTGTGHIFQAVDGAPFLVIRNSAKQAIWEA